MSTCVHQAEPNDIQKPQIMYNVYLYERMKIQLKYKYKVLWTASVLHYKEQSR